MTRKKDTDPATPTQAADIIPAQHGLDAIKARIDKMRQQSPVREPGEPAGRGPLPAQQETALAPATPAPPPSPPKPAELEQCSLPGVPSAPKGKAPMGNQLARTPLFAPITRGRRQVINKAKLPSPDGITLWYFGQQLDTGDQDVYLTALMLAKEMKPDTPIVINRAGFLKLMGRNVDGRTYKWLMQSFERIATGVLFYDIPEERGSTPLVGPLRYNKETGDYYFTIPKESLRSFGFNQFGYVDMEQRRQIEVGLGKWLQCYAVSHAKGEHRVSVENLQDWSGITGRTRQFRATLQKALADLVKAGVIKSWEFYGHDKKVKWIR